MRGRVVAIAMVLCAGGTRVAWGDVDYKRAAEVYADAEKELAAGAYDDAARDYGEAYEITKDPVVFYKIGLANEKAGKCSVALAYYGRYLKEARPEAKFVVQTNERIKACSPPAPEPEPEPDAGTSTSTSTSVTVPAKTPETKTPETTTPETTTPERTIVHAHGNRAAWLLVGGTVTMITLGAVMTYAAHSSEADVADLYVGLGGKPPTYDAATAQRYADLLAEGARYQHYAWTAFSIAGASAIAATIVFLRGRGDDTTVQIAPTASPTAAGVSAAVHF